MWLGFPILLGMLANIASPVFAQTLDELAESFGMELRNKVTAEALVSVQTLSNSNLEYQYTLINSTISRQDISGFALQVDTQIATSNMSPAPGWEADRCCMPIDGKLFATWSPGSGDPFVKRGAKLTGFKIVSKNLPGMKEFRAEGFTAKFLPSADKFQGEPTVEEGEIIGTIQSWDSGTAAGATIGPDPISSDATPASLLERLIAAKHQSVSFGWISGPGVDGVVQGLDAKLNAAKDSVARDQNKTAANQLKAFVSEIEAQRGKHLNDNAYFLLKVNAEFIISRLGP